MLEQKLRIIQPGNAGQAGKARLHEVSEVLAP
jgi:hypothetical protein